MRSPIPLELLERKSLRVHGKDVVADVDLAKIYGVSVRAVRDALRRHAARFPDDFVIRLENGTCAFTEEGILMLAAVLMGPRAVQINIELIRSLFSDQAGTHGAHLF